MREASADNTWDGVGCRLGPIVIQDQVSRIPAGLREVQKGTHRTMSAEALPDDLPGGHVLRGGAVSLVVVSSPALDGCGPGLEFATSHPRTTRPARAPNGLSVLPRVLEGFAAVGPELRPRTARGRVRTCRLVNQVAESVGPCSRRWPASLTASGRLPGRCGPRRLLRMMRAREASAWDVFWPALQLFPLVVANRRDFSGVVVCHGLPPFLERQPTILPVILVNNL